MNLKKYNGYFFSGIKQSLEFKSEFYSIIIFNAIKFFIIYLVWKMIFPFLNDPLLNFNEIIIYYLLFIIKDSIPIYNISNGIINEIKSGDISVSLSKPISFIKKTTFSNFGLFFFNIIFSYLIFIIISIIFKFNLNYFYLIIYIIPFFIFDFTLNTIYGLLAFWFIEPWGIRNFIRGIFSIFDGSLLPLFLYPEFFQNISKLTPFYHGFYSLSLATIGKLTAKEVFFSISILMIWSLILYCVLKIMYKFGIKKIEGFGG